MNSIHLIGHVDENGRIEISERVDLPPGDVTITVESISEEKQAALDTAFDDLLASPESLAFLETLGAQALADLDAGLTDELDPDNL